MKIIKILKIITILFLPIITLSLYFLYSLKENRLIFTLFILFFIAERTWEGLYTSKEKDRDQIEGDWTLPISILSYIMLVLLCLIEFYIVSRHSNIYITITGIIGYIFALFLRIWGVKSLGDQWSTHIIGKSKLEVEKRLVINGAYRYMRHPIYLGIILEQISIPLIANLYFTFFIALAFTVSFQLVKIRLEETEIEKRFGDSYVAYKKSLPAFSLFLWDNSFKKRH